MHHVGTTYLKEISGPDSVFNTSIAYVMMEAGARLDWHKHPGGQILMITEGEGYYQERNKPKQTVRKGEVVKCQPDVEHWHGATPESAVSYMASSPAQKGKTVWLDKLSDEDYFRFLDFCEADPKVADLVREDNQFNIINFLFVKKEAFDKL